MKPLPAPSVPGNTEAERFDNAVRKMFIVSKEDVLKEEARLTDTQGRSMNRRFRAALMGLFFAAAIATPVCAQAADSWDYIKVLSGPGNINGAIAGINHSWVQLKFKWSSPCPSPRSLIITARGTNTDLASKRFGDLWPVGEVGFLLPPASDTVTVVMTNGPCEANSEVQIFATKTLARQYLTR